MSEQIRALVERSVHAYRRGRFMRLLGKAYKRHVDTHSDAEVIQEILGDRKRLAALQLAFQDNSPRPDEIYLYATRGWGLVTNQRLFLFDKNRMARPPIEISDIVNCKGPKIASRDETIELSSGEIIKLRSRLSPDDKALRMLVSRSNDPKATLSLHVPASQTAFARQKKASIEQAGTNRIASTSSDSGNKLAQREETFGSILAEFWPALAGFCVFVMVLIANGAPVFEGGPAVIRWLGFEKNMSFFYLGILAGVIAAVFAARGELIPSLFKARGRKDRDDD